MILTLWMYIMRSMCTYMCAYVCMCARGFRFSDIEIISSIFHTIRKNIFSLISNINFGINFDSR